MIFTVLVGTVEYFEYTVELIFCLSLLYTFYVLFLIFMIIIYLFPQFFRSGQLIFLSLSDPHVF